MFNTKTICLYGGPCVGKSTEAADLYVQMKRAGYNVELVREVAKKWAWQGREIGPFDQMAILGKQMEEESSLFGKVEYVITDSPAFLGGIYLYVNHEKDFMMDTVKKYYDYCEQKGVIFKNFLIPRAKKYDPKGRYESEFEAEFLDSMIKIQLAKYDINFIEKTPTIQDIIYETK